MDNLQLVLQDHDLSHGLCVFRLIESKVKVVVVDLWDFVLSLKRG